MALRLMAMAAVVSLVLGPAATAVASEQPQPPKQPEEFVPINELPPEEQLPAAPLLVTAYAFVWVAVMAYLWSIRRRLDTVEKELADVARRMHDQRRSL
jgi:CcmD family protein